MKIGICDYGIGGIGLYKLIRQRSTVDVVYFSDSGYTPYGKVPEEELRLRLQNVIKHFNSLGISHIAVACNAASTVTPKDEKITGIIEHGINLVSKIKPTSISVVGGIRTIESNLYKKSFEKMEIQTVQKTAQQLSIRIEAGDIDSAELDKDIHDIFEPIKSSKYILLACTHYPVISEKILRFTKNATLLDPAEEMANWIFSNWTGLTGNSSASWLTTGNTEQMKYAAQRSYNVTINQIEKISL
jgi:glutamate racemase